MSKGSKRMLMTAAALCIVGAILLLAGWLMGGSEYVRNADLNTMDGVAMKDDAARIMEKTKLEGIKGVEIQLDYMDLEIVQSENETCYLEYAVDADADDAAKEGASVTWTVTDGVLSVKEKALDNDGGIIGLPDIGVLFGGEELPQTENRVILYIPKGSGLTDSAIRIADGDLTIDGAEFSTSEITVEYGDVKLTDAVLQSGQTRVEDGDVIMKDAALSGMKLTMEYGKLSAVGGLLEATDIGVEDGNVTCADTVIRDACSVSTEYGDVELAPAQGCLETLALQLSVEYGEIILDEAVRSAVRGDFLESGDAVQFIRNLENPQGSLKIVVEDGSIVIK